MLKNIKAFTNVFVQILRQQHKEIVKKKERKKKKRRKEKGGRKMKKEDIEKIMDVLWAAMVIVLIIALVIGSADFLEFKDKNKNKPANLKISELCNRYY